MNWLDKLFGKDKLNNLFNHYGDDAKVYVYYKVIAPRYFGLCGNDIYYAKHEVVNEIYEIITESYSSSGKVDIFDCLHAKKLNLMRIQITESEYLKATKQT